MATGPNRTKQSHLGLRLTTSTIVITGVITLVGWLWLYSHDQRPEPGETTVLAVAALVLVLGLRAIPYRAIFRALGSKRQRAHRRKRVPSTRRR